MITLDPSTLLNGRGIDVNSLVTQALSGENSQVQLPATAAVSVADKCKPAHRYQ